jgi:hypothetical protein
MKTIHAKFVVLKTKDDNFFSVNTKANVTINLYEQKWRGLRPFSDDLIKDAIIEQDDISLKITGKKVHFHLNLGERVYDKRYLLFNEKKEDGKKLTVTDIIEIIKYKSAQKLILQPEDIKVGYDGLLNWILRKKIYYLDTNRDIISKFEFLVPSSIKQKPNGKFFIDSSAETTITSDFVFETTNYTINNYKQ